MDLNAIMSNIYGEGSSQNFNSLGFTGGQLKVHRATIKYLDEDKTQPTTESIASSYRATKIYSSFPTLNISSITGGAAKDDTHIFPSAEYIDNSNLQKFIKEFYLHYLVANAHKNMLLVVPSDGTLNKLISEFKAILKKEGIAECSTEASKYAAKTDLAFKNYIFDVYGRSSSSNEGYPYQVDGGFPEKGSNEIYRRTNRASKQYFFKFTNANKIEVADNDKFTGAATLKFLGKCDRSVLVLQGDIPESSGSKSKVVKASITGGGKSKSVLRHEFLRCVKRNQDLDSGAYEFIARVSKASGASKIARFYSGDYVHTAFSIIAANESEGEDVSIDKTPEIDDSSIDNEHNKLIDNFKPVKNIVKLDKVQAVLPKIMRDACSHASNGPSANKLFINNVRRMYNAIKAPKYMLAADIACALTKNNDSIDGVRNALNIMASVEETEQDGNSNSNLEGGNRIYAHGTKSHGSISTPLIRSVYSALVNSPFIGTVAKEYAPVLISSGLKRSAFEDHNAGILDNDDNDNSNDEQKETTTTNGGGCNCGDKNCPECNKPKSAEGSDDSDNEDEPLKENDFQIKAFF